MQFQTVNIALPKKLLQEADKLAKKEYRNRSELIREAVKVYIKIARNDKGEYINPRLAKLEAEAIEEYRMGKTTSISTPDELEKHLKEIDKAVYSK